MIENVNFNPKEEFHTAAKVEVNDSLIQNLNSNSNYVALTAKYSIDMSQAEWHYYKGIPTKNLLIPIQETTANVNKFIAVYYDERQFIKNIKVMSIEKTQDGFTLAFSDAEEKREVKGIYKNDQYIETQVNGQAVVKGEVTTMGLQDCLQAGFEGLPLWLKSFCAVACGAVWTGAGLAACAGCLVGLGIDC
ncbi:MULTISPECIES: hypothetical protein [Paenibacillus]|uniref:Uncharacterized protein n=1 Tax=Paenibacillus pabuli TaxID=1472 RepID=A0A855Y822_9BACL|nr:MULTISPECIES: hypothetical protein [Paenibacillus]PWW38074.1 hypothetical protein DET56_108267 [Paenibacillus pabuli]PXW08301.1 hypothetical protein DEU73_104267 [Paenibacillus taichungensis]RAI94452.1 hypothetical protein DET54_108252 [Paenibacillus pabuli]